MATFGIKVPNLVDVAKRLDPDGKIATVVDLLSQTNEVLIDMGWIEGNLPTGHRTTVRTGLPDVAWRLLNAGVQPSKSTTAQVDEGCGILEAWSEVDKDLAELNGNVNAFRLSEATAFVEAMNQEFVSTLFYGNATLSPSEFTGLAPRYSSLAADIGRNIISAGGSGGDCTSIWLVGWSPNTITGIYPKGSKAGLSHTDLGIETVEAVAGIGGARMRAYREQWQWKCGIALRDWRYAVRAANIDTGNLVLNTTPADIVALMIKMVHRIPNPRMVKMAFYMNRTVFQYLDIQRRDDVIAGGGLIYKDVDGMAIPSFRGIPIRVVDALLNTEATVA